MKGTALAVWIILAACGLIVLIVGLCFVNDDHLAIWIIRCSLLDLVLSAITIAGLYEKEQ